MSKNSSTPDTAATTAAPKVTKKAVVIKMISDPEGSTIDEMAAVIVKIGKDPDLEKNKRVVRLWLSKLGMPVKKDPETNRWHKA